MAVRARRRAEVRSPQCVEIRGSKVAPERERGGEGDLTDSMARRTSWLLRLPVRASCNSVAQLTGARPGGKDDRARQKVRDPPCDRQPGPVLSSPRSSREIVIGELTCILVPTP